MNEEKRRLCIELLDWLNEDADPDIFLKWCNHKLSAEEVYNLFLEDKYL